MRIVMTPDATDASGGGDVVVTEKVEVKPPVAEANVEPKGRFISDADHEELSRLRTEAADRKAKDREAEEAKLRDQGKWKDIVKARETERDEAIARSAQLETRTKKSVLGKELASALSDPSLVKGAAAQLAKLWADEFEVKADGDEWRVETRDRKSPADFVREKLATEEFAHFVKADARGGAGGNGSKSAPTDANKDQPKPGSVQDIANRWKNDQKSYGAFGLPGFGTK